MQRTLSSVLWLCPARQLKQQLRSAVGAACSVARGHRLNASIVLAAVHGLSGLFRAVSAVCSQEGCMSDVRKLYCLVWWVSFLLVDNWFYYQNNYLTRVSKQRYLLNTHAAGLELRSPKGAHAQESRSDNPDKEERKNKHDFSPALNRPGTWNCKSCYVVRALSVTDQVRGPGDQVRGPGDQVTRCVTHPTSKRQVSPSMSERQAVPPRPPSFFLSLSLIWKACATANFQQKDPSEYFFNTSSQGVLFILIKWSD